MTRFVWRSTGKVLDDTFLMWIKENPAIIVPPFRDVVFPNVQFSQTKLVALGWDPLMFYNNVNRRVFPNLKTIEVVGNTGLPRNYRAHADDVVLNSPIDHYFRNGQIRWKSDEWVNHEWLSSQFNELFAKCQEMLQNELRPQLK